MQDELTLEQQACNNDTWWHIHRVQGLLGHFIRGLWDRGHRHDRSKLYSPEVELFTEFTGKLAKTTYGSEEYNSYKKAMKPALDHHYANNSHHPEHYKNGVEDMDLLDIVEMFCDWKAASERHNDGNILKSIEINTERFGMSPQLRKIFENTAKNFGFNGY